MADRYYLTTAISYPNGRPHIGHAYELIATDVIARFKRLDGFDVLFLTGTDEHGIKMLQTARAQGLEPAELARQNSDAFEAMGRALASSNDDFMRTTQERHKRASQEIWRRMEASGDIYKDAYSGWYSVRDEAYYAEDETRLTENGTRVGPQGTPVEWVEEESYFFRLGAFQERLIAFHEANPGFVAPNERRNEIMSFLRSGLRDLSISRTTFDWGIPVPGDESHVMYVWVDALTNYLTATGYLEEGERSGFWPADLHVIGKDIVRFHTIYWPAFLMSAGLPLPRRVFVHGFLFNKGEKMSKSVGNVIDPMALAEVYGLDQLRYFLLREVPFGQDGNYSHEAIVNRINSELANDLGNLAQRSLSMIAKNCGAVVPTPGDFTDADRAILASSGALLERSRAAVDRQELHAMLAAIVSVVSETNRYFAAQEPWVLRKSDPARMGTVLYVTAEILRRVSILLQPFMPGSMDRLLDLLAVGAEERSFADLASGRMLEAGRSMPAPQGIFPRFVDAASEAAAER